MKIYQKGTGCIPGTKRFKQKRFLCFYSCVELAHLYVEDFKTGLEKAQANYAQVT